MLRLDLTGGDRNLAYLAITTVLISQAPTLRHLSMPHDALPHYCLGTLASLQWLTHLTVSRPD